MSENTDAVRWGVLSTADIGMKKVIPAMQAAETIRVEAIASRSTDRARSAAGQLGIPRWYGSYEDLLADPEIEAVYIPLPNHLHAEWTKAAARAGKHVLCEKPLAMTASEAAEMASVCSDEGVLLMEAFMYRLHPQWARVMEMVGSESIGQVRSVVSLFSYFNDDPTNIRNIPDAGGGALYDIGCYTVNVSRLIMGSEPTGVKSFIERDVALGTDVVTSAVLDFDGRHASFVCSTQMESAQRVEIVGTKGRIVVEIPFNIPPDRPTRVLRIAGGDPPVAPDTELHEVSPADQYTIQGEVFSRAVRHGSPLPVGPDDAVANMEVIERIFADAAG